MESLVRGSLDSPCMATLTDKIGLSSICDTAFVPIGGIEAICPCSGTRCALACPSIIAFRFPKLGAGVKDVSRRSNCGSSPDYCVWHRSGSVLQRCSAVSTVHIAHSCLQVGIHSRTESLIDDLPILLSARLKLSSTFDQDCDLIDNC